MRNINVVAGVLAALVLAGCSSSGGADEGDGFSAEVMCEEFVKDRLKSPGSAEFSEEEHVELGPSKWKVTGVVDSENSFGALLRADYSCVMTYEGGDQWRGTRIQLTPR